MRVTKMTIISKLKTMRSTEFEGYNLKERAYITGGTIAGALAPIIAGRYLLVGMCPTNPPIEAAAYGVSLLFNTVPSLICKQAPIPVFTGIAGGLMGSLAAADSKELREKQKKELYAEIEIKKEKAKGLGKILHLAGLDKVPFRRIYRSKKVRVDYDIEWGLDDSTEFKGIQLPTLNHYSIKIRARDKQSYKTVMDSLETQFEERGIKLNINEIEQK